jgi:hypothetical protein
LAKLPEDDCHFFLGHLPMDDHHFGYKLKKLVKKKKTPSWHLTQQNNEH